VSSEERRVFLLTGATGAIGRGIARGLAVVPDAELLLGVRDRAKGERLLRELGDSSRARLSLVELDVSRHAAVRTFAHGFSGPLHLLVNNAAIAPRERSETPEGIERQLATNVLGYLWLTELLGPALERGARSGGEARVVNVASYWAGDLDVDDLEFCRRRYDNDAAYRQSKQANRMLTRRHAELFAGKSVRVNACHPGDVRSTLSESLGFGGHESAEEGARTPLWLALDPALAGRSGGWYERRAESHCRFANDADAVRKLYAALCRYTPEGGR